MHWKCHWMVNKVVETVHGVYFCGASKAKRQIGITLFICLSICPSIILFICLFFSSPEPKARVSYCHSAPSVVRPSVRKLFTFSTSSPGWILMKLGRDEVLMVPYKCCCFSARSPQGRIQGGAKIGHGGVPFFNKLLLQTGRLQRQTECIAMI